MSGIPNKLLSFTGPLYEMQMTLNEASVERKISQIWKVLQVSVKFSTVVSFIVRL
jgi:hypothetical protein